MRLLSFLRITLALFFTYFDLSAQVIPSDRFYDWSGVGFRGTSPDYANSINIMHLGTVNDSSAPAEAYIQQAIDSLNGRQGVIYFPPGNYLVSSTISLPDSIVLKGAGADSTTIIFNLNGAPNDCFDVSKNQDEVLDPFTGIISGFEKGSVSLTVNDGSSFAPNAYAEIRQDNGSWDSQPATWAEKSVGQIVKIVSVSGNMLLIEPPLRFDFDTALNAEIRRIRPVAQVGIECMKIIRVDSSVSNSVYNINFNFAVNGWVRGVESAKSMGAHVLVEYSKNIEVSGCYFHHSFGYDGSGTRGYGVCLRQHASDCLVENNFFRYLRHAMMVKEGANGNVFAYNYSIEPHRSEPIPDFSGDISLHGHFAFANLFEGNIVQNIIIDQAWGQSGPHNTFLRNRAELYGMGVLPGSPPYTNDQNFVGNEITSTALLQGNYYTQYGTGHFEFGNNVKGVVTPSGTSPLPDSTYYLSSKPAFWNSTLWPTIGIPNNLNTGSIPAKERYVSAQSITVCKISNASPCDTATCDDTDACTMDSCISSQCVFTPVNCDDADGCTVDSCVNGICNHDTIIGCYTGTFLFEQEAEITVRPNPAKDFLIIESKNHNNQPAEALILDFTGRLIFSESIEHIQSGILVRINFPENMGNGLYLLRVICGEKIFNHQFIRTNQ